VAKHNDYAQGQVPAMALNALVMRKNAVPVFLPPTRLYRTISGYQ